MVSTGVSFAELYNSILAFCVSLAGELNIEAASVFNYDMVSDYAELPTDRDTVGFTNLKVSGMENTNLISLTVGIGFSVVRDHNLKRLNTEYINHLAKKLIPDGRVPIKDQDGYVIDYLLCSSDFEISPPIGANGITMQFIGLFMRSSMVLNSIAQSPNSGCG